MLDGFVPLQGGYFALGLLELVLVLALLGIRPSVASEDTRTRLDRNRRSLRRPSPRCADAPDLGAPGRTMARIPMPATQAPIAEVLQHHAAPDNPDVPLVEPPAGGS